MNPETNNQNVGSNEMNNVVTSSAPVTETPVSEVSQPVEVVSLENTNTQTVVQPVIEPTVQTQTIDQTATLQATIEPVVSSTQEQASTEALQPNEPIMASNDNVQNNESIEVMPDLSASVQTPVVNTVAAPSKVEQTTITENIDGMAQEPETAPVAEENTTTGDTPVDDGIREEVKLDMSVAMEGVPTIDSTNVTEANPTQETQTIEEMTTQTEVNTQKSKTSNLIIVIILLVIAVCIYFMDDIMSFFTTTFIPTIKNNTKEEDTSGNLIDGYIKLGDSSSFMKMGGIKFYNFTTSEQNKIIFSYITDKKLDSTGSLGYYIVLYNKDKEITYKELFNVNNSVEKEEVNQYKISIDADVYQDSKYGKVIKYSDEELQKKYKITCTYTRDEEDGKIKLKYENIYSFENDLLVSYSITKDYTLPEEETETSKKYKAELDNENEKISGVGIKTDYKDNKLFYNINLNKLPDDFIPLYKGTSTKTMIIKKENLKKWECK